MSDSDELSIPEIARRAGVSQETVHNWINKGLLQPIVRFQGLQRRSFVQREEWERFAATLPSSSSSDA